VSDSQLENIQKLIDTLPPIEDNHLSELGPLISCDRGYGKRSVLRYFAEKNFKVITIIATAGSEHPIVTQSKDSMTNSETDALKPASKK
jgi:hypothetical protein